MNNQSEKSGARAATRARILDTFNRLLLDGAAPRPKVSQIIDEAGVSRSTFYDHFDGVEVLLDESLTGLFGGFAQALVIRRDPAFLQSLIEHIGENRQMAREFLSGDRGDRAQALFARVLEKALEPRRDARLTAILIAGTTLTALKNWTAGRIASSPKELAGRLMSTADVIADDGQ